MVHCFSPDSTEHWTRYICVLSHTSQSHFLKNPTTVTLQLVKNWRLLCTSATFNWPHFVVFTGHYLRSTCSNLSRAIPEDSAAHLRDHGSGRPACSCRGVHGPSCESNDVGVKLPIKSTTHGVCRACKSNLEGPHQTDPAVVYIYIYIVAMLTGSPLRRASGKVRILIQPDSATRTRSRVTTVQYGGQFICGYHTALLLSSLRNVLVLGPFLFRQAFWVGFSARDSRDCHSSV